MNKITFILFGLLIPSLSACINNTVDEANDTLVAPQIGDSIKNISYVNGKYLIDTNAILRNNHLYQFIEDLEKTELDEKNKLEEISPMFITFLEEQTEEFLIANPGEDWEPGCTVTTARNEQGEIISGKKPKRQLVYFGLGPQIAMMVYYKGGLGKSECILLFRFDDTKIIDFWCGHSQWDLTTKKDILKHLKENMNKDWGLNTNKISL